MKSSFKDDSHTIFASAGKVFEYSIVSIYQIQSSVYEFAYGFYQYKKKKKKTDIDGNTQLTIKELAFADTKAKNVRLEEPGFADGMH